ncbi:MAG: hypothetical protein ACWGHO_00610 [Candidatus Moraniibacteriota bacterium]
MSDEKTLDSNLEPINDDLSLAKKFGHIEKNVTEPGKKSDESEVFSLEKEASAEILNAEKDSSYNQILSKVAQKSTEEDNDENIKSDAKIVSEKMDAESQIQHLVDLASTKGAVYAVKVARHMDDNYVLDMLHDKMISEELHRVLVEKNLLAND